MDPTYAASLAVLRRILAREVERMDTNDEQLAAVVDDHI
jgi:hypothetical protein